MIRVGCTGTCVSQHPFKAGGCLTLKNGNAFVPVSCVVLGKPSLELSEAQHTGASAEARDMEPVGLLEGLIEDRDLAGRDNVQTGLCYPLSTDCTGQAVAMNGPSNGASNMSTRCV